MITDEYLYELKQGVAALMRASYEVISACNQIEYACRKLLPDKDKPITSDEKVKHVESATDTTLTKVEGGYRFVPNTKPKTGDPLAELQQNLRNLTGQEQLNLIQKLQEEKK